METLRGKKIVIFGGTGELMGHIALGLAQQQARIIIIGRDPQKAQQIQQQDSHKLIQFIQFDILEDDCHLLFDNIYKKYEYIDGLINGAGVNSSTTFLEINDSEINNIFEINFNFVCKCCQIYIQKTLQLKRPGRIINIGSVSALNPLSKVFMYSASKAAIHNLSKNLAREYGSKNITTNILVPGFFPAEQNRKILSPERVSQIISQTPMRRFGNPSELIGMVSLLLGQQGTFINGAELVVDGGYSVTKI